MFEAQSKQELINDEIRSHIRKEFIKHKADTERITQD